MPTRSVKSATPETGKCKQPVPKCLKEVLGIAPTQPETGNAMWKRRIFLEHIFDCSSRMRIFVFGDEEEYDRRSAWNKLRLIILSNSQ